MTNWREYVLPDGDHLPKDLLDEVDKMRDLIKDMRGALDSLAVCYGYSLPNGSDFSSFISRADAILGQGDTGWH